MAPVLEDLSEEYAGFVRFAKSNVDDNPQLARRFNVMSIPTLLVFDGGKVVGSIVGAAPAETIREKISEVLGVG
jgi:thioredoxin 1